MLWLVNYNLELATNARAGEEIQVFEGNAEEDCKLLSDVEYSEATDY